MKAAALLVALPALLSQPPSPQSLVEAERALTIAENATVLNGSRRALAAKTFRLSSVSGDQGTEVLMGSAGQPKLIRTTSAIIGGIVSGIVPGSSTPPTETRWREDIVHISEYTGRPARHCDGSAEQGEMVIDYMLRSAARAWTATARRRDARDGWYGFAPAFEMLRGAMAVTSGERRRLGDRWARAFVAPWAPPPDRSAEAPVLTGDPMPNVAGEPRPNNAIQSLWIDIESLLPLRFEVSRRGLLTDGFDFTYEPIDLRPPAGIDVPQCIQ